MGEVYTLGISSFVPIHQICQMENGIRIHNKYYLNPGLWRRKDCFGTIMEKCCEGMKGVTVVLSYPCGGRWSGVRYVRLSWTAPAGAPRHPSPNPRPAPPPGAGRSRPRARRTAASPTPAVRGHTCRDRAANHCVPLQNVGAGQPITTVVSAGQSARSGY